MTSLAHNLDPDFSTDTGNIKARFLAANIHPICIAADEIDPNQSEGANFLGNFDEYLAALHALQCRVVYIAAHTFNEHNFYIHGSEDDDSDVIDLRSVNRAFRDYERYLGENGIVQFTSSLNQESLNYFITKDWWHSFIKLYVDTAEAVEAGYREDREKLSAVERQKEAKLLNQVKELASRPDFQKLRTQRAMLAYAQEHIPELSAVPASNVRLVIQSLYDKIKS